MNVSAWSIRNPIPAVMLFVLLTFGGLLSFNAMKVQNFPDIDLPTVTVTASLPGAAPSQLETDVARKLENSIATIQGLKHITTKVQDGAVTLITLNRPQALNALNSTVLNDLIGAFDDDDQGADDVYGGPGIDRVWFTEHSGGGMVINLDPPVAGMPLDPIHA